MRQWDTKKRFTIRWRECAQVVFLLWWMALVSAPWREIWDALRSLGFHLGGFVFGLFLLIISPLAVPLLILVDWKESRARRYRYLVANRQADADI